MANEKSPAASIAQLIFAPAASAIFVEEGKEKPGVPLANAGFDPDEPRLPAGLCIVAITEMLMR